MIPIPPFLAAIPAERLAKIVFGLGFALCFFLIGMGVHKTFSDRKIAQMERDWAEQKTAAAEAYAQAERSARETERRWQEDVQALEAKYRSALRQRDRVVHDLRVAGAGLRSTIDGLVAASQASATADPACRDVHKRVEVVGVLLTEVDGLAEESGIAADGLREELALCRTYVEAVTKRN
jgi:hypothetical protein